MKHFKKFLVVGAGIVAVIILVITFCLRDRYVVPIVTYHNVSSAKDRHLLNNVAPDAFARQMDFLKTHGYNVIDFDDYVDGVHRGRDFARNTVVIHFDDGYDDNYTNAFPVLKEYGFPAHIFLVSAKMGTPGYLTWDQMKEMEKWGIKAGAHTRHHVYLPAASLAVARDEIAGSKKEIEEHLGHRIDYFVYPSGGFNDDVEKIVKESGFKAAATTNRGFDRFNRDLFALKRVRLKSGDSDLTLWAKLSGYYNLFRRGKAGGQESPPFVE